MHARVCAPFIARGLVNWEMKAEQASSTGGCKDCTDNAIGTWESGSTYLDTPHHSTFFEADDAGERLHLLRHYAPLDTGEADDWGKLSCVMLAPSTTTTCAAWHAVLAGEAGGPATSPPVQVWVAVSVGKPL